LIAKSPLAKEYVFDSVIDSTEDTKSHGTFRGWKRKDSWLKLKPYLWMGLSGDDFDQWLFNYGVEYHRQKGVATPEKISWHRIQREVYVFSISGNKHIELPIVSKAVETIPCVQLHGIHKYWTLVVRDVGTQKNSQDTLRCPKRIIPVDPSTGVLIGYCTDQRPEPTLDVVLSELRHRTGLQYNVLSHGQDHLLFYPIYDAVRILIDGVSCDIDLLGLEFLFMFCRLLRKWGNGVWPVWETIIEMHPIGVVLKHIRTNSYNGLTVAILENAIDWLIAGVNNAINDVFWEQFPKNGTDADVWEYWISNRWMVELTPWVGDMSRLIQAQHLEGMQNPIWCKIPLTYETVNELSKFNRAIPPDYCKVAMGVRPPWTKVMRFNRLYNLINLTDIDQEELTDINGITIPQDEHIQYRLGVLRYGVVEQKKYDQGVALDWSDLADSSTDYPQ
jgi:hypothetical protein